MKRPLGLSLAPEPELPLPISKGEALEFANMMQDV
jgi:hypothetical protein